MTKDDSVRLRHMMDSAVEAASRVTTGTRLQTPNIPWSQIVSLRHRLIHGYDTINMDILWKILTDDLPPRIAQLQRIEGT